jgi:hypothetical protein
MTEGAAYPFKHVPDCLHIGIQFREEYYFFVHVQAALPGGASIRRWLQISLIERGLFPKQHGTAVFLPPSSAGEIYTLGQFGYQVGQSNTSKERL